MLYGDKNNWFAAYAYWYLKRDRATWFVLRELLGYPDVRNDDGSSIEWGNLVDVPIARGSEPG